MAFLRSSANLGWKILPAAACALAMRHWQRAFGIGCVALCVVVIAFPPVACPPEPVYGGKTLSQWLDDGYEPMSMTLHETGPAAAPFIFSKLENEHPSYSAWAKYRKVWRQTPDVIQRVLPQPRTTNFDEERACSALLELGPGVIPALAVALKARNPAVRIASAWALGCFRQRGLSIAIAVPNLTQSLRDANPEIRRRAAFALSLPPQGNP